MASKKIDPNRLFADGGTGFKLLAIIGGALGGVNAHRQGGRNMFLEDLDRTIDRDIRAQEVNLDTGKWKANQANNMLAQLERSGMNRAAAKSAVRASYHAYVQDNINAIKARTNSATVKTNADRIGQESALQQAKHMAEVDQYTKVMPQTVQVGGGGGQFLEMKEVDEEKIADVDRGVGIRFGGKEDKKEYTRKKAAVRDITDNIDLALKLRSEANPAELANPLSSVNKKLKALQASTDTKLTVYEGQGAMSKGDREVSSEAIGAMTGMMGNNDEVLRQTKARAQQNVQNFATELGGQIVKTGYLQDKQGRLVRGYAFTGDQLQQKPQQGSSNFKPAGKK